jgi:hypothetical protein
MMWKQMVTYYNYSKTAVQNAVDEVLQTYSLKNMRKICLNGQTGYKTLL